MAIIRNQATLSYGDVTLLSNITEGVLQEALTITKTPIVDNYTLDQNITYIINIINSGTTVINGFTVTDSLGAYPDGAATRYPLTLNPNSIVYTIDGVVQPRPTVVSEQPMVLSGFNLPAGSNASITYEARVNEFAPLDVGSSINNIATAAGGDLAAPIEAPASITPTVGPALTIQKEMFPVSVSEGDNLTYSFIISNYGNADTTAATNTRVTDTFTPRFPAITSVTLNNVALPASDYTYEPTTGVFNTTTPLIIPAATYGTDPATGATTITPSTVTLRVTGTV